MFGCNYVVIYLNNVHTKIVNKIKIKHIRLNIHENVSKYKKTI